MNRDEHRPGRRGCIVWEVGEVVEKVAQPVSEPLHVGRRQPQAKPRHVDVRGGYKSDLFEERVEHDRAMRRSAQCPGLLRRQVWDLSCAARASPDGLRFKKAGPDERPDVVQDARGVELESYGDLLVRSRLTQADAQNPEPERG